MKTLFIISNLKPSYSIAAIFDRGEDLLNFFKKDKNKLDIFSLMLDKELLMQKEEKADFTDFLNKENIASIIDYDNKTNRIRFAFKENGSFVYKENFFNQDSLKEDTILENNPIQQNAKEEFLKTLLSNPNLKDKKEWIEEFLNEINHNPTNNDKSLFENFIQRKKEQALQKIIKDENLNENLTKEYFNEAFELNFFQDKGERIGKLLPPLNPFASNEEKRKRIIDKLKGFFNQFIVLKLENIFTEEKNYQGENNVTHTHSNPTHQPLRNGYDTTKQLQPNGRDESFEESTYPTHFTDDRKAIHTKNREDDTDFTMENSKNEFKANGEFLQTNSTQTQSQVKRTLQEMGRFDGRDGFSDKLPTTHSPRDREENTEFQSRANKNIRRNQSTQAQKEFNETLDFRSEGIRHNQQRYDATKLRTRIDTLLQSEFARSLIDENILSSLELFRIQFRNQPNSLQSHFKENDTSNGVNSRTEMGTKLHVGFRDARIGGEQPRTREEDGGTRESRKTDGQQHSQPERLNGELAGGDRRTTEFINREFDRQGRGLPDERVTNTSTHPNPATSENTKEIREFQTSISEEFSNSFNESYNPSLKETDSNTEIQKREFSTDDLRTTDTNSQPSLKSKQQEFRASNETEFSFDDGRIPLSPITEQNSTDKEFSQSQTPLSLLQEPTWYANERGEFTNANTELEFRVTNEQEHSVKDSEFKIFENHQFLKKLDGENYKTYKEFKFNTKERIKANYEALELTQLIFNQGRITATAKEQEILAQFSGYGGLRVLFYDEKYKKEKDKLLELVGAKYFKELKNSTQTAFYTPDFIIFAMYERLFKLGLSKNEKIKVLEPSCGIGKFMSLAPANFEFEAVEKDTLTATIAKFLHPKTVIHNKALEDVRFNKEFDLVVGNPPYAKESVYDLNSQGHKESLHNYFSIRGAELLKENGLLSFVISSYFLDSKEAKHRNIINHLGTFIDSYRLSNEVFKDAQVLSDLIFYSKRKFSDKELRSFDYQTDQMIENFAKNPIAYDNSENSPYYNRIYEDGKKVLGKLSLGNNQYGLCLQVKNKNIEQDLKNAIEESLEINAFKNNPPYENKALILIDFDKLSTVEGRIDLESLQSYLPSKNLEQILTTLLEKRLIFHSIEEKSTYELAEQFLSGNVKKKHAHIQAMIANKESFTGLSQPLNEILLELEKVFPAYVNYEDIHINFGSNFIGLHIYEKFIEDTFFKDKALVSLKRIDGGFYVNNFCVEKESPNKDGTLLIDFKEAQLSDLSELATNFIIYNEEGKIYFDPKTFIEKVLNNKSIEVFHYEPHPDKETNSKGEIKKIKVSEPTATKIALEKKEELIDAFQNYLFNHKNFRDEIEKSYNDKINVYTMNKNSYAKFFSSTNLSKKKNLREHQKNVIFKGIMENSLLLDHQVGAGKTLAGVCIVMEQIRMGLVQKALILVPNHLTGQWQNELKEAYADAKVLIGDKINNKKDRKEFLHRIKYGNYEVVLMKESTFENLNVLESYERGVYYDYIENLRKSLIHLHTENLQNLQLSSKELSKELKRIEDKIERKIKRLEKKLENKAKGKEFDSELAFEDLGFDLVMVDEAHHFKNLLINTNQDNIRGLSTTDSAKAMKMYCVSKFIHENKHKFYFLTGTPVSNSIAEFFTMQKYLQPKVLEDLGLSHFDDWQRTFTQIVDSEELDSSGINYKIVSRLSQFVNAPELMATYLQNADVVSIEDVEKAEAKKLTPSLKEGKVLNVIAPRSEEIASYIGVENEKGEYNKGSIIWRMDNIQEDPRNNNMLKCTSDARKAALDFRLIDNNASDYEESKINQMCQRILNHYEDKNYPNNTQLIFCDMGVSKKHSQNIDPNEEQINSFKSLETLKEELGLVLEYDEEREENFYARYEYEDEEGKKLKKAKLIQKYTIEELLELSGNSFDIYADILKKLVKRGVLQKEIAFIGDANTDKQKQDLFDKLNAGEIRVLIGSTMKMGAGTNVQRKVVALHELDCPWRPCDLEQRQGRVIRQGNEWFEKDANFCIAHYRYSTEQTYDARMFQVNEQKLKPLAQLKQCDFSSGQRSFNSIDSELASIAEMKAYATGNPFILEKHKISTLLKSEQRHYDAYKKSLMQNERALAFLQEKKTNLTKEQAVLREMVHSKDFEKENYALEAFGIQSYKKCKNKADEEDYKKNKNFINFSIKEYFSCPRADEELEILKANGITLVLKGYESLDNSFVYQGIMKFDTGESYRPNNLVFKADHGYTFYAIPEIDGLLERIKNNFNKASEHLNKISTILKNTEAEIKIKEDFLSKNELNAYPKKILLDTLKKDEKNMNEIFVIRNQLRKKGIKLEMNSKEIKQLLPKYPQFFNEKGKFDLSLTHKKEIEQKSVEQKAKELKDVVMEVKNIEIDFKRFDEKDSLKVKVNTLLSNQENINKSIRARDILK